MLTLNADNHASFKRMHKPINPDGFPKEKRGGVMFARDKWDEWLACVDPEVARTLLSLYPAELMGSAQATPEKKPYRVTPPPARGDLF